MLPCMPRWWNQRRVERKRNETIFAIEGNRVAYEDMLRRAVTAGGVEPRDAADVAQRFRALREKAQSAATDEEQEQLADEAEALAQLRAYFCPEKEIALEGRAHIFTLLDWGVSIKNVE